MATATPPDLAAIKGYLGTDVSWDDDTIEAALEAEREAQASRCRIPSSVDPDPAPDYPAALAEALGRRVAHNLALRSIPLGVVANITDSAVATNRVGGLDAEVARLEGPYRRVMFG